MTVVVGNSSSGLIETQAFGVPAVDIGRRQYRRIRSANVLTVPEPDEEQVYRAVVKAVSDQAFRRRARSCRRLFGKGGSGEKIAKFLKELEFGPKLMTKKIVY